MKYRENLNWWKDGSGDLLQAYNEPMSFSAKCGFPSKPLLLFGLALPMLTMLFSCGARDTELPPDSSDSDLAAGIYVMRTRLSEDSLQEVMQPYVSRMEVELEALRAEASDSPGSVKNEEAIETLRMEHGLLMEELRQSNDSPKAIPAVVTIDGDFIAIQTQTNMGNPILYFGRMQNGGADIKHTHVSDGKELTTQLTGKVENRARISGTWSLTIDEQVAVYSGTWTLQRESE